MPKIKYKEFKFKPKTWNVIKQADEILREYKAAGLPPLTLRQLYYQFVSRDLLPNKMQSYKRLSSILNDARLAGLVDWQAIVDNTRNLRSNAHWDNPQSIITACATSYMRDRWEGQKYRVEAWIEKDALASVLEMACSDLDVPFFACKGYSSVSELWSAGMRLKMYADAGQVPVVIHLGDHDPSGMDMTRDNEERLRVFLEEHGDKLELERIALNMDQVKKYKPPPNPAKVTDSRYKKYEEEFGTSSWELDALNPRMLVDLVRDKIKTYLNKRRMDAVIAEEKEKLEELKSTSQRWQEVVKFLKKPKRRKKSDGKDKKDS